MHPSVYRPAVSPPPSPLSPLNTQLNWSWTYQSDNSASSANSVAGGAVSPAELCAVRDSLGAAREQPAAVSGCPTQLQVPRGELGGKSTATWLTECLEQSAKKSREQGVKNGQSNCGVQLVSDMEDHTMGCHETWRKTTQGWKMFFFHADTWGI